MDGLTDKYQVTRTDQQDAQGCKHHGCRLFVLDFDHDPAAQYAIAAYCDAAVDERPDLVADLRAWLTEAGLNGGVVYAQLGDGADVIEVRTSTGARYAIAEADSGAIAITSRIDSPPVVRFREVRTTVSEED